MHAFASLDDRIDYFPCRYGQSRNLFRGPRRRLRGEFVACIGGTETFGRLVEEPYPALLEREIDAKCVNLGCLNAGVDAFLEDLTVHEISSKARYTILQIMGADNLSNRYYMVHPRRNDRFLRARPLLHSLFPEVDFTEFHFTNHMLGRLSECSEIRFQEVVSELRSAWSARMGDLLGVLGRPLILIAFVDPEEQAPAAFVTDAMIAEFLGDGITYLPLVRGGEHALADPHDHRLVADMLARQLVI